jgi:iron complex outermembrane receptor protein
MKAPRLLSLVIALLAMSPAVTAVGGGSGHIEGRVLRPDGIPMPGVGVVIDGTSLFALTDDSGHFEFRGVRAGAYSLTFTLADNSLTRPDVVVEARATTTVEQTVDWQVAIADTVTVRAVSRQRERIVDAPAAVTTIPEREIEKQASQGNTPKLLEFTPGVDITQTSVTEFLVSTRGFNGALNRRVPLLIDGRDVTDPFIGVVEWSVISFPLDDFAQMDLVRGPASTLYGANATGGIMSITTRQPRYSQGGMVRLTAGELDSLNADLRWAGKLGGDWYMKVVGGRRGTTGYSVSRTDTVEYSEFCDPTADPPVTDNCLPRENIPFPKDEVDIRYGGLRFDKYLPNGSFFTFEGGTSVYDGTVFISTPGRGQIQDVKRPWARFNFTGERWNVLAYWSNRDAEAVNLVTGNPFLMEADNYRIELQTNRSFVNKKVQLVAGGSFFREKIDSNVTREGIDIREPAVFGQVDWRVNRHLELVGGLRWDDSTLHDPQWSPKAAVVYAVNPRHSVRLTYSRAFQVPTYGEFFFRLPTTTVDLSGLNQICLDNAGVDCGLGSPVPWLLSGNESLDVEQVQMVELGYKGIFGSRAYLTVDLYQARNEDFMTTLLPQRFPGLDPVNPNFGPWVGPSEAETTAIDPVACPVPIAPGSSVAQCIRDAAEAGLGLSQLTNLEDESVVLGLSVTTIGRVDTRGAEVGFGYFFNENLRLTGSYTWFDFEIVEGVAGLEGALLPNTPEHKASLGLSYAGRRWDASLRGRWVDGFLWVNASYRGQVEPFTTFDLVGNYSFNEQWKVGLNVANVFDEAHWEAFGGDLIGRRALFHVSFAW